MSTSMLPFPVDQRGVQVNALIGISGNLQLSIPIDQGDDNDLVSA
jgi:hypothetical protein